jgi:parvulin-like peptidyl-prolyl isomerase
MKKNAYVFVAIAMCVLAAPAALCADAASDVIVTVGDEIITRADLNARTAMLPPQIRGRFETESGRKQFIEQVVLVSLLSQEARRLGIDKQDAVAKKIKEMTDNIIVQELTRQKISRDVTITDEEIEKYYKENKKDFVREEQVNVSMIMFATPGGITAEDRENKKAQAEKTLKRLKDGADFADVAREVSEDQRTGRRGGITGFFRTGRREKLYGKKFEKVAFELKTGEMSDVFKTERGYFIIRVDDHQPRTEQSLKKAKSRIVRKLQQVKQKEAYDNYVEGLKEKYPVKYSD